MAPVIGTRPLKHGDLELQSGKCSGGAQKLKSNRHCISVEAQAS
jgi:hypothetical protein